jgi:hypothetical protein
MAHEEVYLMSGTAHSEPTIGETTLGLGEHLVRCGFLKNIEAYEPIRRDALAIVKRCRPFRGPDGRLTGLVVGYVQSGKTVSMTCVSALARDNGCRIIIVLAGVTTLLLQQNENRFRSDLRGVNKQGWLILNSERAADMDERHLRAAADEWRDPLIDESDRRTLLIMVLKNHVHLERLSQLLRAVDLRGIPALVIDDEADQAGLNTAPGEDKPSTNYGKIEQIRGALPHHTYLQYTATPQAPLLIQIDDLLSPAFAELIEPGEGYTGGKTFFGAGAPPLIRSIPDEDHFKPGNPPDEVPQTLLSALRVFFLGSAVAAVRGKPVPYSMLVHPSQRKADHERYASWISEIVKRWAAMLRSSDADERAEVVEELRKVYFDDLSKTCPDLPPFETLLPKLILNLGRVAIKEVNSEDGSEIDWENSTTHILVGGEKLNRGFTVEGLAVTYMPRNAGGWNADTLQQRARFFGYKQGYLGLCRLYLHPDVTKAFRDYVIHEEDVRRSLVAHRGQPLSAWRRVFLLSAEMRPTRRNVLSEEGYRIPADKPWFLQRHPHTAQIPHNAMLLRQLENQVSLEELPEFFGHLTAEVALADLVNDVLGSYGVDASESVNWYGQLVTLAGLIDKDPGARALVVRIRRRGGESERKVDGNGIALLQGRSSSKGKGAYPGDAQLVDSNLVTLQLHWINVKNGAQEVPAIALHIPTPLRRDLYLQASQ